MGFDKYGSGESFESCDKFGSGGSLYVPDVSETVVPGSIEDEIRKVKEAFIQSFKPVIEELTRIVQNITDVIVPYINPVIDAIKHIWDLIIQSYPDKRIVWLATHHKKERIRKKNRNRILKWIERMNSNGRCEMDQDYNRHFR
jgi:hypothetical protein